MTLAAEIREAFAKIRRRYEGDHEAIASMRVSHVCAVETHIETLEDRLARCTCAHDDGFQVDTARADAAPYRLMEQARIDRMLFGVSP